MASAIKPSYQPPFWLPGGHFQTIWPSFFRHVSGVHYCRERIHTPDGDFLDLDWSVPDTSANRLMIFSHGLEGDTTRPYALGMVRAFNRAGWAALAWNCRSCSGEMNLAPRLYHHGATDDLGQVVNHALKSGHYTQIAMVGISLGANLTLKYMGENGDALPSEIIGGAVVSAPMDLAGAEAALARPGNQIYMHRFLKKLKIKLTAKAKQFPGLLSLTGYDEIRRFRTFDERYTAPLHGFAGADDYYKKVHSGQFLKGIRRPTYILNALNDPFLSENNLPEVWLKSNALLTFETTAEGGHVGFSLALSDQSYSELRALEFVSKIA